MEDFLSLLVVFIIYLIAASSKNKKKTRQKKARARSFKTAFDGEQARREPDAARAAQAASEGVRRAPVRQHDCKTQPIHLHEVRNEDMLWAGEGEDPCHAGGVDTSEQGDRASVYGDAPADSAAMQDVLRGVIMSEILTRPCERAALRRNGRRG